MSEELENKAINIQPANLWAKIKAQCLNINPFLRTEEDGQVYVTCPRCRQEDMQMNYVALSVEPDAVEWACPILKCPRCKHLFAFVR